MWWHCYRVKKIEHGDPTKYSTFYSSSTEETIINESNIDDLFESIYSAVISNIQKSLGKGLSWIINSVVSRTINISNYNPLAGSRYIKLLKEVDHPKNIWLIFKIMLMINVLNGVCFDTSSFWDLQNLWQKPVKDFTFSLWPETLWKNELLHKYFSNILPRF